MRRNIPALLVLASLTVSLQGGEGPSARVILETWDAAYLQGHRAGYVRTLVEEIRSGTITLHRATMELRLTVKRFESTIQLGMDTGTIETSGGKVVGTFMKQFQGKNQVLRIDGLVKKGMLHLTLNGTKELEPAPWNDKVVGLFRQQLLFQERAVEPGDRFSFESFEPTINLIVAYDVTVKEPEEVELFAGKEKAKLLRVELKPPRIEKVQLPHLKVWLKEDRTPLRSESEIPGLGKIVLYRTSKANALSPTPVAKLTDIGIGQYVRLKQRVPRPHQTTAATYRIRLQGDEDPTSAFADSPWQKVGKKVGDFFELRVEKPVSTKGASSNRPGVEFTESSYFIASNDPKVVELSRRAVGGETDIWRKAVRIERWVHANMKVVSHEQLATADHVARTLEGDCSEFAMLTAAMCRAAGIPSRTAVGLVYADVRSGPVFAFHMWTEVWVEGEWRPLDATLGQGGIGAAHLKIADASWANTRTMTPLFPVLRVLGRVGIEVMAYRH